MNLDDLRKQRPSLARRSAKEVRPSDRPTISMNELRRRYGLDPTPPPPSVVNAPEVPEEVEAVPTPPPPKSKMG